uniref:Uncharacterized protein n=1 Tax=Zea mays TaxID=4577 RepID=C4J091_MAIZE|nr:unknown [Zea mays]
MNDANASASRSCRPPPQTPDPGAPRNESSPWAALLPGAALGSSRKRSSGTRNAPCAATRAPPTSSPEMMSDATEVKNSRTKDAPTSPSSVSRSEKARPKRATGWSDARKR